MTSFITNVIAWFQGTKTYWACAIGIVAVLFNHFIAPLPWLNLDTANWVNDIYTLILVATGRSAIKTSIEAPINKMLAEKKP